MTIDTTPTDSDRAAWLRERKQTLLGKLDFYGGMAVVSFLAGLFTHLLISSWPAALAAAVAMAALKAYLRPLAFKFELRRHLRDAQKNPPKPLHISLYDSEFRAKTPDLTIVLPARDLQKYYTGPEGFIYMVFLGRHHPIPPGAFASVEQRQQFLSALERLQSYDAKKQSWWTQESTAIPASPYTDSYKPASSMSVTVTYSTGELETLADRYLASEAGKEAWRRVQVLLVGGWLSIVAMLAKYLFVSCPHLLVAASTILVCILVRLSYPIYLRRRKKAYTKAGQHTRFTLALTPEGVQFTESDEKIIYPWESLSRVELLPGGFIEFTVRNFTYYIPPSAFADSRHEEQFLNAMEAARQGRVPSDAWWTQGETITHSEVIAGQS